MIRVLIILVSFLFINFSSYANEDSKKCIGLYEKGKYSLALPYCLKSSKGHEFYLGYIYSRDNKCSLSHRWYKKSGDTDSMLNMSIQLIYGTRGCKQDINRGKNYLLEINDKEG